ncbi:MAG: TolC family protein [Kofleriaceae bacterium]
MRLCCVLTFVGALTADASAEDAFALPSPLPIAAVVRLAKARRGEVIAARARTRAANERPAMVSALEDPEVFASIDHVPFALGGADMSLAVQQRFPLSHVRGHRQRAAEAEARGALAEIDRVRLNVELEAASAFWMLAETRETAMILDDQRALAAQMVAAATARYATNTGAQADVLRAELEVDRLDGDRQALAAEIRAAEVMLATSIARAPDAPIPALEVAVFDGEPPAAAEVASAAIAARPELRAGRAEVARAQADVSVMKSMYTPMAMVRIGPSYTMSDGAGWMVMVGLSIPLWRDKLGAQVREARAMADMTSADLDAMRRMITGDAVAARERVAAARARYLALRDRIVPRAGEAIAPTLTAYASNQLPLLSALEAAQALWSVQRELVMSRAELGRAWARLSRATGDSP